MEENRINEIGKMTLPDKVCIILKAIGSCCSCTAPIVSLLSDFQNHKQNLLPQIRNRPHKMTQRSKR